ncbi:MAG TPA: hypothetical protein VGD80_18615, partial [Kofleriaceae bacterium]
PLSGAARVRRFLGVVRPLIKAGWGHTRLAELVIESGRWAHPPCRNYVAELLADRDRKSAIRALVSRFADAERRA